MQDKREGIGKVKGGRGESKRRAKRREKREERGERMSTLIMIRMTRLSFLYSATVGVSLASSISSGPNIAPCAGLESIYGSCGFLFGFEIEFRMVGFWLSTLTSKNNGRQEKVQEV
jgi:hypothetical protein